MSDYENLSKINCIKMRLKSDVGVIMALKLCEWCVRYVIIDSYAYYLKIIVGGLNYRYLHNFVIYKCESY